MYGDNVDSKLMSARDAVSKYVRDGCQIALGGFTVSRNPMLLTREIIRQGDMDLALTDMNMPGMDGLQLTREILSRNASLPVLLLTAHEDAQLSHRALESGVRRCLVKDEGLMDGIADVVEETLRG